MHVMGEGVAEMLGDALGQSPDYCPKLR